MKYTLNSNNRYTAQMWQRVYESRPFTWNGTWKITESNLLTQTFDDDQTVVNASVKWNGDDDFVITITKHPLTEQIGKMLT